MVEIQEEVTETVVEEIIETVDTEETVYYIEVQEQDTTVEIPVIETETVVITETETVVVSEEVTEVVEVVEKGEKGDNAEINTIVSETLLDNEYVDTFVLKDNKTVKFIYDSDNVIVGTEVI